MCRLYGFRASEATKVECTLVHAQNALMVQSQEDLAGGSHAHGWGVATYEDHLPEVERQAWAAYHGEHFRRAAARIYAPTVVGHVRRATVGAAKVENTHPFSHDRWSMIHNGTIPAFDEIRPILLDATTGTHRDAIEGDTDSEHVFRYLLSLHDANPGRQLADVVCDGIVTIINWCRDVAPDSPIGLNIIMTNGTEMVGTRYGRTLHFVERAGVHDCEICGFPHVHHDPRRSYRAVVIASEPISHETWREVPDGSLWQVSDDFRLKIAPLCQLGIANKATASID